MTIIFRNMTIIMLVLLFGVLLGFYHTTSVETNAIEPAVKEEVTSPPTIMEVKETVVEEKDVIQQANVQQSYAFNFFSELGTNLEEALHYTFHSIISKVTEVFNNIFH
ncbi:hypothetical protein [Bacillus sp. FJAT-45350]|uniref:hypothetical protein n=1 Tax=Bacillus sp. FJAT-45350 TaxID=2011014 RepID=UPI000BB7E1A2|nr:hypothetical protein [Bacillus sp. FJAT-45350]